MFLKRRCSAQHARIALCTSHRERALANRLRAARRVPRALARRRSMQSRDLNRQHGFKVSRDPANTKTNDVPPTRVQIDLEVLYTTCPRGKVDQNALKSAPQTRSKPKLGRTTA